MNRAVTTQHGRLLELRERFDRITWRLRYRVDRSHRQILTLLFRMRALADDVKAEGRSQPSDPLSIEDRTKRAEAELRKWMEEHPNTDPREDSIIDEIAESWVPVYNHDRRVQRPRCWVLRCTCGFARPSTNSLAP